jgi:hypothetical protein
MRFFLKRESTAEPVGCQARESSSWNRGIFRPFIGPSTKFQEPSVIPIYIRFQKPSFAETAGLRVFNLQK